MKRNVFFFLLGWVCLNAIVTDSVQATHAPSQETVPRRIVSINLCTDELLVRLVAPERIAALTKHSANQEISTIAASVGSIPAIRGGVEDVVACKADLLVGGKFSNKETLRFFQYSEVPVLVLDVPKNFDAIYANIRKLAQAVGESEKGEAIIQDMQKELAALRPESSSHRRAIFFQSGNMVPGSGTFENAIMEAAGLENVAAVLGIQDYGSLPLEKLIEAKPDILILATDQTRSRTVRGEVLEHPAIKKALPDIRTVTIPAAILNCGSPASVEAVRILVKEFEK